MSRQTTDKEPNREFTVYGYPKFGRMAGRRETVKGLEAAKDLALKWRNEGYRVVKGMYERRKYF